MSKLFSHLTTDEERMRFVLERNFGGGTTLPWTEWRDFSFAHKDKDRAESQRLRNFGNQVYQKNKLGEALEYYSQSICYAPHPQPPNSFLMQGLLFFYSMYVRTFSHNFCFFSLFRRQPRTAGHV